MLWKVNLTPFLDPILRNQEQHVKQTRKPYSLMETQPDPVFLPRFPLLAPAHPYHKVNLTPCLRKSLHDLKPLQLERPKGPPLLVIKVLPCRAFKIVRKQNVRVTKIRVVGRRLRVLYV